LFCGSSAYNTYWELVLLLLLLLLAEEYTMTVGSAAMAAAGVALGSASEVFSYNRTAWSMDISIKLAMHVQRQTLLLSQVGMFREDIRDLCGPAMMKQQNLMLVVTVILGVTVGCYTQGELPEAATDALPHQDLLYHISIGCSLVYLMLSLTFAVGANYLSWVCQRDMLINVVRLPVVDLEEEIVQNRETVESFEHQSLSTMLRMPGLSRFSAPVREGAQPGKDASRSHDAPPSTQHTGPEELTSTKKAEAFRAEFLTLFREKEVEWETWNRYASMCAAAGIGNLLQGLSYFAATKYGTRETMASCAVQFLITAVNVMMSWEFSSTFLRRGPWMSIVQVLTIITAQGACGLSIWSQSQRVHHMCAPMCFMAHFVQSLLFFYDSLGSSSSEPQTAAALQQPQTNNGEFLKPTSEEAKRDMVRARSKMRSRRMCLSASLTVTSLWLLFFVHSLTVFCGAPSIRGGGDAVDRVSAHLAGHNRRLQGFRQGSVRDVDSAVGKLRRRAHSAELRGDTLEDVIGAASNGGVDSSGRGFVQVGNSVFV